MSTTLSPVTSLAQLGIDTSCPSLSVVRVAVVGEIDLATVDVLHDGLRDVLSTQIPDRIDVDLAGVTFMDCAGLGALVAARHAAVRAGRDLRITNPQPIVHRVLELTGLLSLLTATLDPAPLALTRSASASPIGPIPAAVAHPTDLLVAAWPKPRTSPTFPPPVTGRGHTYSHPLGLPRTATTTRRGRRRPATS